MGGPPSFITLDGLRRQGWQQIPGRLASRIESAPDERPDRGARQAAADAGLAIEVKEEGPPTRRRWPSRRPRRILALAILAMTVGLIRSESAGDLRTLVATGRPPASGARSRRPLPARWRCSARSWASPVPTSCSALYYDDLGYLSDVPIVYLALAIVGVPLAAAAAGWLPRRPRAACHPGR